MVSAPLVLLDVSDLVVSPPLVLLDDEPPGVVALPVAEPLGELALPEAEPLGAVLLPPGVLAVSDDELLLDEVPGALPLADGADEGVSVELLLDDELPGVLGAAEPLGALLLLDELLPGALAGGLTVVLELDDAGASRPPPAVSVFSTRQAETAVSAALTAATSIKGRKSIYAPFSGGRLLITRRVIEARRP